MGTSPDSPDRIRAGIESTRKELAHDVDELADRASPAGRSSGGASGCGRP